MSKKQMGFTLIEIVMVLVLLGILSAVAVPKYFDLRDKAEEKAAAAIAAEVQARVNGGFANALLNGVKKGEGISATTSYKCADAQDKAVTEGKAAITDTGSSDQKIGTFTTNINSLSKAKPTFELTLTGNASTPYKFQIAIPQCN